MELDPKYADVIVRRWQEYTGKVAVLGADGRPFAEVGLQRLKVPESSGAAGRLLSWKRNFARAI